MTDESILIFRGCLFTMAYLDVSLLNGVGLLSCQCSVLSGNSMNMNFRKCPVFYAKKTLYFCTCAELFSSLD